ncbi:MAG: hypothetical protein KKF48_02090 [Nanoarchaeota archaeon]|nr:hypothetical protein [Nanoarchaeota archaeon]MBU1027810.1 hypothetical protein [Nanoarchaeota archaeon]
MYQKYLIIACKKNPAATNITTALSQFRKNPLLAGINRGPSFDFYLTEEEVLFDENLDLERINKYDFVIFPCTHKSEQGTKSLSIHAPGNWRSADFGGKQGKVCPSSALFQKFMFEKLRANIGKFNLEGFEVTLECTHHGPLINKPCVFIEIGSSENEWSNRRAGFVIAKTISETIERFKPNQYREVAIGIGGPHYCPNFNKIQLKSNVAISHIIPNYVTPITEEMIHEAVDKTLEEVDFAVVDWKGLGTSEQRQQVLDILDKMYINWKRTSEVDK